MNDATRSIYPIKFDPDKWIKYDAQGNVIARGRAAIGLPPLAPSCAGMKGRAPLDRQAVDDAYRFIDYGDTRLREFNRLNAMGEE